jgi:hypothetical protein
VRLVKALSAVASLSLIAGCGGGGGSDSGSVTPPPSDASAGGIWEGTEDSTGLEIVGLVTESGEFHFIRSDGVQYFGTAEIDVNTVSADFTGVTPVGTAFPDGSVSGTGTLAGTVQERQSMTGSTTFRTSAGDQTSSDVSLTYNPLYERDSSLGTVAGNYVDPATNAVVNVNGDGTIFSQDAVTGCVINGEVSIIDSAYNAYRIEYEFSGCQGDAAVLNGTMARGLATLDNTVSPEQAVIGVVNAAAGYSLVGRYNRT